MRCHRRPVVAWVPNGDCRYTMDAGTAHPGDVVVSRAGVVAIRYYSDDDGAYRLAIAFPEQAQAVADLTGRWNFVGMDQSDPATSAADAVYVGAGGAVSIGADGKVDNVNFCPGMAGCEIADFSPTVTTDAAGGFRDDDGEPGRWFVYQSAAGKLGVMLSGDGTIFLMTPQRSNNLPAVGDTAQNWNLWVDTRLVSTAALSESGTTVTAVDANAGTWTRQSTVDGHLETLHANSPFAGYSARDGATAATSSGDPVKVQPFSALPLAGMGMSVLWLPEIGTQGRLGGYMLSLQKP